MKARVLSSRTPVRRIALALLLMLQSVYAFSEYPQELQTDRVGHVHLEYEYHDSHVDDLGSHEDVYDHDGHCHGQIHSYLIPALTACGFFKTPSRRIYRRYIHYYSIHISPDLRPPARLTSFV